MDESQWDLILLHPLAITNQTGNPEHERFRLAHPPKGYGPLWVSRPVVCKWDDTTVKSVTSAPTNVKRYIWI